MNKSQFRILYCDFLHRMFDVEILSTHARGDASSLFGQLATFLICLSIVLVLPAVALDGEKPGPIFVLTSWGFQHFLIATTMVVVGLFAVLNWNTTFPEKRDVLVLAPLPVRARTIFVAKIAASGTALAIAVLALHSLAGVLWPAMLNKSAPPEAVPAFTSEPAMPALSAANLQSVLDRDMAPMLRDGALAPGTGGGVAIGVYKRGVRRVFAYGAASPNSLFEIGSITKTFTGLLLADMVEKQEVTFEEPVRSLLPESTVSKPAAREITLLDLATHHSGLPGMPDNLRSGEIAHQFTDYHAPDVYAYLNRRGVQVRKDAGYGYSNLGFGLLGIALANREGISYAELLRQRITGPLHLEDTVVDLSPERRKRLIQGYNEKHEPVAAWDLDAFAGAGGIRSSAGDILSYLEANLHPEALAAALRESHKLRADVAAHTRIALAWFYDETDGIYVHTGATGGYTSYACFNPRRDYAVVALLNNGPSPASDCVLLGEHVRQRLAGEPTISLKTVIVPSSGGWIRLFRSYAVYWLIMFAAGAFMFGSVLTLQGIAAQLPRRYFLRISSWLQIAVFGLLVGVYFSQPGVAGPDALVRAQRDGLLAWSPSFWFLGLYQQMSGSPALTVLAQRAWAGLGIAVAGTGIAYTVSYFRNLQRILEEPDIAPGSRRAHWLPRFGGLFETAVVQFSIRTLTRSRQHRLLAAFYGGLTFAVASFLLKSPGVRDFSDVTISDPWRQVSMPLLASTILLMAFAVIGLRVVFALPMDLAANWVLRVTPGQSSPRCMSAYRRALWILAVVPVSILTATLLLPLWPWRAAWGHLTVLTLFGALLVELCLYGNRKIPFTCSWLPGRSNFHITSILCAMFVFELVTEAGNLERAALEKGSIVAVIFALAVIAALAMWRNRIASRSEDLAPQFEETPSWGLVTLNLH